MKVFIWIILIILIIAGFYFFGSKDKESSPIEDQEVVEPTTEAEVVSVAEMMKDSEMMGSDEMMKKVDDGMMKEMMTMTYQYSGRLEDVTRGDDVRGLNTGGESGGVAQANYADGKYNLLVTFENLPDPVGTDFYEGWIVRKGLNFDVISSGVLKKVDGVYTNTYSSGQDLTDHDFYVLTLEPDDGNPAPADHILEGTLISL
jgi:hypothetical protein